jgi:3alpha(or 20beta)-hydroxysteroid dehydrogenase
MDTPTAPTAIVTGGSRGIGAATVKALNAVGYRVLVADLLDDEGVALADECGPTVRFQHLDITSEDDWHAAIDRANREFGTIGALVNNAGILDLGDLESETRSTFQRVLDVNLVGAWLGIRCAATRMHPGSVIVNVSSTAGLVGYAGLSAYVASKWGLRGLTKAAALELGGGGIRVCSIHPGPIRTPMTAGMSESLAAGQPIPRFGAPEEVASMIRFVITEATYSTGCEFIVDGGATAGQMNTVELADV